MFEVFPAELRNELAAAQAAQRRGRARKSRLRVQTGAMSLPVLRRWDDGFALDAARVGHLRGLVDLYDGSRHLMHCLIVASAVEENELICTVKSATPAADRPPVDFVRPDDAPAGLLPRY
ncbi:hypothetical protein V8J36_03065 [Frigidibacter sp. MR17.14]|uniref:hypothetical protein n=1 Tax=Frigidibacter sp. MR17.14 TaxID=3126509 RepID=UPI0030130AE1